MRDFSFLKEAHHIRSLESDDLSTDEFYETSSRRFYIDESIVCSVEILSEEKHMKLGKLRWLKRESSPLKLTVIGR